MFCSTPLRNRIACRLLLAAVSLFSIFLLGACSHFQTRHFSEYKQGSWEGKALIRDKKAGKTGIVNLKVKAINGEKLRLDVTSPVGTHVASVLLKGDRLEILNVSDKVFYESPATRESLLAVLRVPIDPRALYNVFFETAFTDKNWSCASTSNGLLQSCKELKSKLEIEWSQREGDKRRITLQHSGATVQMNLTDFDEDIEAPEKAFQLQPPSSFKRKKL